MTNSKTQRLSKLRSVMKEHQLDGFLVPLSDAFLSEYPPKESRRLEWLTGFSGSSGMAVILEHKAAFFTDGRYTLQADQQVDHSLYEIHNFAQISPWQWVHQTLDSGNIGFDPWIHDISTIEYFQSPQHTLTPTDNLIDMLWEDKPSPRDTIVQPHPLTYTGESHESKRQRLASQLTSEGLDAFILTASDSICWLLNIRGNDLPHTPLALCYAVLHSNANVTLCIDKNKIGKETQAHLGEDVQIILPNHLQTYLQNIATKKIGLDKQHSPYWFALNLPDVIWHNDPCLLPKAIKNDVEIEGFHKAHLHDGAALTKFLCWLDGHTDHSQLSEMSCTETLLSYRKQHKGFLTPSFDTIAGFAANGAIIHYHATEKSNLTFNKNGLFLLDSGGQYKEGTTDVTRTIAIGTPTKEQKTYFTLVLKGHIALAKAQFPKGTTGSQLDVLARQFLWKYGADYQHGTGHGVGSYLSVHEGPQRISKKGGDVPLELGMVLSNEPGYYKAGEYGIRIENLVVVVPTPQDGMFGFETLTLAPIDINLINTTLLTIDETQWLNHYHTQVYYLLKPMLDQHEIQWLHSKI